MNVSIPTAAKLAALVVLAGLLTGCGDTARQDVKGLNILDMQYGESDRSKSIAKATAMIQANARVDGLFASNEPGVFGVLRMMQERKLKGKIKVVGFDASDDLVKGLEDGYIDALVAQDPFNIGYEAVHQMVRHLNGEKVEKIFKTDLRLITRDNLDTPAIKDLLTPPLEKYLNAPKVENPKFKLAVVPKGTVHVFWKTVQAGAIKAGQDFKCEIIWKGTEDESQHSKQADIIESFITAGVDGLVIGPTQAAAQVPAIEKAVSKGIPVVIFDSEADTDKYISFVATDNYKGGVMAAEKLNELLGGKGNICIVGTMPGGGSTMFRENGFLETMKKLGATGADKHIKAATKPARAAGK